MDAGLYQLQQYCVGWIKPTYWMTQLNDVDCLPCVTHEQNVRYNTSWWNAHWEGMALDVVISAFDYLWVQIEQLDILYWKWVVWVIYPIVISFLLPFIILLFFYGSALFLQIYSYRHRLRDAYQHNFWDGARQTLAAVWVGQARIWHGYEIHGLEKIPNEGPAILIYYHGALPVDFYYIMSTCILEKSRQIRAVGDQFLFKIPGWRLLMEVFCVTPGTVQNCVQVLKDGHILAISPGGVREAQFGDEYYRIMWGKRVGFAKVALTAKVPVIPVFTQNLREAFRTPGWGRSCLRRLYERTRLPMVPIYGFFPVKLRTFLGDPIYPDLNATPEQHAHKIQSAMQALINQHQMIPGNILRALLNRLSWKQKQN